MGGFGQVFGESWAALWGAFGASGGPWVVSRRFLGARFRLAGISKDFYKNSGPVLEDQNLKTRVKNFCPNPFFPRAYIYNLRKICFFAWVKVFKGGQGPSKIKNREF